MEAMIHIQRKWDNKPEGCSSPYQRLSYDLTRQTDESLAEMFGVMKALSERSNGEFECYITGNDLKTIYSTKENGT